VASANLIARAAPVITESLATSALSALSHARTNLRTPSAASSVRSVDRSALNFSRTKQHLFRTIILVALQSLGFTSRRFRSLAGPRTSVRFAARGNQCTDPSHVVARRQRGVHLRGKVIHSDYFNHQSLSQSLCELTFRRRERIMAPKRNGRNRNATTRSGRLAHRSPWEVSMPPIFHEQRWHRAVDFWFSPGNPLSRYRLDASSGEKTQGHYRRRKVAVG
jgi:hypothetical protein